MLPMLRRSAPRSGFAHGLDSSDPPLLECLSSAKNLSRVGTRLWVQARPWRCLQQSPRQEELPWGQVGLPGLPAASIPKGASSRRQAAGTGGTPLVPQKPVDSISMRTSPARRMALVGVLLAACASTNVPLHEVEPQEVSWEEGCQEDTTLELVCAEDTCAFFRCRDLIEAREATPGEIAPARWPGLRPPGGWRRGGRLPRSGAEPIFLIRWNNHPAPAQPAPAPARWPREAPYLPAGPGPRRMVPPAGHQHSPVHVAHSAWSASPDPQRGATWRPVE
jgi:hypothetical protein